MSKARNNNIQEVVGMGSLTIPSSHIDALLDVINHLKHTTPLTADEKMKLHEVANTKTLYGVLNKGLSWGEASGDTSIYQKPQDEFFADLKSINDNLYEQVKFFSGFVEAWFTKGSRPPPYYTDRIAIILRKAKLFELEKEFLKAYFKHFWSERGSAKDRKLGERAVKVGINIPSIPLG